MSHTNVTITTKYDAREEMFNEIEILKFKLTQAEKKISGLKAELENVPKALKQYGYIDITWDEGLMKVVPAPVAVVVK